MKMVMPALKLLLVMTVLAGGLYTFAVTAVANILFSKQSRGSLIEISGQTKGSSLIGQKFSKQSYFWPRPSASDYKAVPSGASNLGPTSSDLKKQVEERMLAMRKSHPTQGEAVPADMLFASGSGLDPHISPEAADYQISRVAKARGLNAEIVRTLVKQLTEKRQWGFLGDPRVNVLMLNSALDQMEAGK